MSVMLPDITRPPLTLLTEEEQMFRDTVRQFAQDAVASRVSQMDEASLKLVLDRLDQTPFDFSQERRLLSNRRELFFLQRR